MLDWVLQARRLHGRAEELRVIAETTVSPEARDAFLRLATDYDRIAKQAKQLGDRARSRHDQLPEGRRPG